MGKLYQVAGPLQYVKWKTVDLGLNRAGVTLRPVVQWTPIVTDAFGNAPADFILTGKAATLEVLLHEPDQYKTAIANIGRLLMSTTTYAGTTSMIGALAWDGDVATIGNPATIAQAIDIMEADGVSRWQAKLAVPLDPQQIQLQATQEEVLPLVFVILPDSDGKLFWQYPSYLS